MDSNFECILSAQQLLEHRKESGTSKKNFTQLKIGNKVKRLPRSKTERNEFNMALETTIESKLSLIERKRVKQFKDIGEAVYYPNEQFIRVKNYKSKPSFMGYYKDGHTYLYPEEALFLMETESIVTTCNNLPLSIQEAFPLFLKSKEEFDKYKVYSHLSRYGFKLKRHIDSDENQIKNMRDNENTAFKGSEYTQNDTDLNCTCASSTTKILTNEIVSNYDDQLEFSEFRNHDCKNWQELKEQLNKKIDYGYFSNGLILKEPCPKHFYSVDSVLPVRRVNEISTADMFYSKLMNSGPKTLSSIPLKSNIKVSFDCYSPSNKKTSDIPNFHIVVVDSKDGPPSIMDVIAITSQSKPVELLFAVFLETEFNFYKFSPFQCWDEIPVLWQSLNAQ